MTDQQKSISEMQSEMQDWKNQLKFCRDEVKTLRRQLQDIANRSSSHDFGAQLEHFESQFYRQEEVIHDTLHEIKAADQRLLVGVGDDAGPPGPDHESLRDNVATFHKLYDAMKLEFNIFLSQWN
jgi:septal ring factor EnvC (AmiA/AmiB activator)